MWKNLSLSDAAKGLSAALERTGEAMTKKQQGGEQDAAAAVPSHDDAPETPLAKRLQQGWGSVVEATKHAVDATREAVEKEQSRLFAPTKRDPRLPLDKEALRDAEVVYITDRIITMSHPAMQSTVDGSITPNRKLAAVAHLLNRRHDGRYMVWNLSEVDYDTQLLDNQVLAFSFPGSPSPPLGLLLKLLMSMESWLKADSRNVAVVHCLTGKGRTSTVLAAFLCWVGEAGFSNVHEALLYIGACKKLTEEELTIPSQRRYVKYFSNMLDGVRPSQPPLMLKRIIMSEAPKFAKGPPRPDTDNASPTKDTADDDDSSLMGCAPYIQIFKAGQLIFTTAASVNYQQPKEELPFCYTVDGPVSFQLDQVLQGDILIRSRHLTGSGQRVSMFRAAIHTGYVPPKVMRLSKGQLDGACTDKRFQDTFFLDLIFEPCDAEMASKHLSEAAAEEESKQTTDTSPAKASQAGGAAIVTATAYDSMLHRDSRFWDVIAERRQEHTQHNKEEDPMWGPTIGRKRDLASRNKNGDAKETQAEGSSKQSGHASSLHAFSIGGDMDFFDASSPSKAAAVAEASSFKKASAGPPKRDELMDALMALEEDEPGSPPASQKPTVSVQESDIEEIVFVSEEPWPPEPKPTIVALPPKEEPPKEKVEPVGVVEQEKKEAAGPTQSETPEPCAPEPAAASTAADDEAAAILKDADLDLDDDLDALLAGDDNDDDEGLPADFGDLDFDDDDLEDLENMLSQTK